MTPEIIAAGIAAGFALVSAGITIYGQMRLATAAHRHALELDCESRQAEMTQVMAKYRDPLLYAAYDLQSRLYNIVELGFLENYAAKSPDQKDYAIKSTLYVLADYLGWVEILRREVRFLDLGDIEANRRLTELLSEISHAFYRDDMDLTFRLLRGQQRAVGELVLTSLASPDGMHRECIGFTAFARELEKPEVAPWFAKLEADLERLIAEPNAHFGRLAALQHELIDLVEFLDPECTRFPQDRRSKISRQEQPDMELA